VLTAWLGHAAADLFGSIRATEIANEIGRAPTPLWRVEHACYATRRDCERNDDVRKKAKVAKIAIRLQEKLTVSRFPTGAREVFVGNAELMLELVVAASHERLRLTVE
jgi:hypothetical protein